MSITHVAGIGTNVGKTVVSAILTMLLEADFWKPIECGSSDTAVIKSWLDPAKHHIFPPAYSLSHSLSPHHAARLEGITLSPKTIVPPKTLRPLVIEGVGGIYVPLTTTTTTFDLFSHWPGRWIVVSQHYLGSINHTVLTLDALKRASITPVAIIFNGEPNHDSEKAIMEISQTPFFERVLPEKELNSNTLNRYANSWKKTLLPQLLY